MPYKDPEKRKEQWRRWAIAHKDDRKRKEKSIIRGTARHKFKEKKECSIKNCFKIAERHHPDYTKPLDIVWLCNKHHDLIHKQAVRLCSIIDCFNKYKARGLCGKHWMRKYYNFKDKRSR